MGEGQQRQQKDVVSKWIDVKEEVTWFNWAFNYAKNSNFRYVEDEQFMEDVKDFYILEREGRDFEYEDVWKVVKNNQYFM